MTTQADKAEILHSLHVPGTPLILANVWDAVSARIVANTPGVKAVASASHSVSYALGVGDGEQLTVAQALDAASRIVRGAGDLPVTIDFERGYANDPMGVAANVGRLIDTGAVGLNLEDSLDPADGRGEMRPLDEQLERIAAVRSAASASGVPIVLNARVDTLARGGEWDEAMFRANLYLGSGADVVFLLGVNTEEEVAQAIEEIHGKVSVIVGHDSVPLTRLAELGVARVSFGPGILGLALSHLQDATAGLTALGEYPETLGFSY